MEENNAKSPVEKRIYDYSQIAGDIKKGMIYSEIMKKHRIKSKATIYYVKQKYNIKTSEIEAGIHRKKKLQAIAHDLNIINEVNTNLINLLNSTCNFNEVANVVWEMIHSIDREKKEMNSTLNEIINGLDGLKNQKLIEKDQLVNLKTSVSNVLEKIKNYHQSMELKLKAIKEFKSIQKNFIEIENKIKDFKGFQQLLFALFAGFKVLPDVKYLEYRHFVIQNCPEARPYFLHYEGINNIMQDEQNHQDD